MGHGDPASLAEHLHGGAHGVPGVARLLHERDLGRKLLARQVGAVQYPLADQLRQLLVLRNYWLISKREERRW